MEPAPERRPRIVEEPRRTPWPLIIGVTLASIAAGSLIWQAASEFRISIGQDPAPEEPLIQVREAASPSASDKDETAPPRGTRPQWASQPVPEYPEEGVAVSKARVSLVCTIQSDHRLGDCRITDETPSGYGFGRSAVAAAEEARVSDNSVPGETVSFTIRFWLPD